MADLNQFCCTGRLTKDAETKEVNGKTLVTCDVANNTGFGDNAKCMFIKLNLWGKAGTGVYPYLVKGQAVAIKGELSRNDWTGKDGQSHTDIVVTGSVVLLASSKKEECTPNVGSEIPF